MKYLFLVFILSILLGCAEKDSETTSTDNSSDVTSSDTSNSIAKIKVYAVNYSVGGGSDKKIYNYFSNLFFICHSDSSTDLFYF